MKELKDLTEDQIMELEGNKLDEVLSIYRNCYNAANIMVESIIQLGRVGLVDDDIQFINSTYNSETKELFELVGELEAFKEECSEILDGLI